MIRIFFATDPHGSEKVFRKFVNAGKFYKVDVLILGGDITGKMVIPIIKQEDGTLRAKFLDAEHVLKSEAEAMKIENAIRSAGYYPYRMNQNEMKTIRENPGEVDKLFLDLAVETLNRWIGFAEERLGNTGIRIFATSGNDDHPKIKEVLRASEYIINPEDEVVRIDEAHEMISSGWSNRTPWKTPRECSEDELAAKIEAMASKVDNLKTSIFNLHVPPVNSGLDTCPALDSTVMPPKPIIERGQVKMFGAGSSAVRAAIEKHQPLLGLHGHIHESRGAVKIGRTLCANPGSEYGEGILRGAIVVIDEKRILDYQLTSG